MRNKDVIDLIIRHMKTPELMLGSFGTIDKKIPPKYMNTWAAEFLLEVGMDDPLPNIVNSNFISDLQFQVEISFASYEDFSKCISSEIQNLKSEINLCSLL